MNWRLNLDCSQLFRASSQAREDEEIEMILKGQVDDDDDGSTDETLVVIPPLASQDIKTVICPDADKASLDGNVLLVTSHACAPIVQKTADRDSDDESSINDNSDGLNVLSDPRAPPKAGARKSTGAKTLAPKSTEPILYPLAAVKGFHPYNTCGPVPEQYCVSATDIPANGSLPGDSRKNCPRSRIEVRPTALPH